MEPFEAVLFDFHSTLVDNGNPKEWLLRALRRLRSKHTENGSTIEDDVLLKEFYAEMTKRPRHNSVKQTRNHVDIVDFCADLHKIWEHAKAMDPKSSRDLSADLHRGVFFETMKTHFETPQDLNEALYEALPEGWIAYDDTLPMLETLKRNNIKMGLISNIGFDVRPILKREKMLEYFDSIVLSCEMDEVKPSRSLFVKALNELNAKAENTLMVGDDVHADGGAALVNIRTLILPKTLGKIHGLEIVSKLVLACSSTSS